MSATLGELVEEVAFECQVLPSTVRSSKRIPAAVKARRIVCFVASRDLEFPAETIALELGAPVQSVRRLIREAVSHARRDVIFGALLFSLRRRAAA